MLVTTKVHDLEACMLDVEDIEDILTSDQRGVCRAVLTPAAAAVLLKNHNFKNRGIKKHQKQFLQRQMESDKFIYNGETIIVGDNFQILNGQHRLAACVASGKPIEVLIVFGVPSAAFTTLDQGARRSGSDLLTIEGHRNCTVLAACLRQIHNYYKGAIGRANAPGPAGAEGRGDNSFTLELLSRYPGAQESVVKMRSICITQPSVACALHYLFSQVDSAEAEEFCDVVLNGFQHGMTYSALGQAAGMLREWLVKAATGSKSKRTVPWVVANVWIKAWNAGRDGHLPKLLNWKDGIEDPLIIK
jgi:hypothetical protein